MEQQLVFFTEFDQNISFFLLSAARCFRASNQAIVPFFEKAASIFFTCNQLFHYAKRKSSVSMNGPQQLNDNGALEVSQKWIKPKDRRRMTE